MGMMTIRSIPDEVHNALKARAKKTIVALKLKCVPFWKKPHDQQAVLKWAMPWQL